MTSDNATNSGLRQVYVLFLFSSLICQATAVVLGKIAALQMGAPTALAFLKSPWYLSSLICLLLQAFFWQLALREIRLFVAYLFTSLNYFVVLTASHFIFFERVTTMNLIGATVIVGGVYLVIREDPS